MRYPDFQFIRQRFPSADTPDPRRLLAEELRRSGLLEAVAEGQSVAITAGSRGIESMPQVLAGLAAAVKERGGRPFLIPAMGSHGGGTGPGQVEVLAHLGITPETVGCPVYDGWDLVELGRAADLVPVYADRAVLEADHLILVNRVKEHTEYIGDTESGLIKMAAIGLGRQLGAEYVHQLAVNISYYRALHAVAQVLFERLPVLGGVALLEDQRNRLRRLEAIPAGRIFQREPELLAESRGDKPKLPFEKLDFLIIDEIGKDISGTGADTKVVGRIMNIYEAECTSPRITRILIRDLSHKTDGNAIGIGLADYTTRRVVEKMNPEVTTLNAITGCTPEKGRLPLVLENDRKALEAILRTIGVWRPESVRGAWIANSKDLELLAVTPHLADLAARRPDLEVLGNAFAAPFDAQGDLPRLAELAQGF